MLWPERQYMLWLLPKADRLGLKPSGHFQTASLCCSFAIKNESNDNNLTPSQSYHDD